MHVEWVCEGGGGCGEGAWHSTIWQHFFFVHSTKMPPPHPPIKKTVKKPGRTARRQDFAQRRRREQALAEKEHLAQRERERLAQQEKEHLAQRAQQEKERVAHTILGSLKEIRLLGSLKEIQRQPHRALDGIIPNIIPIIIPPVDTLFDENQKYAFGNDDNDEEWEPGESENVGRSLFFVSRK